METLVILYLVLLVAAFGLGWVLGGKAADRHIRREGEADYMQGFRDGLSDPRRHQSTTSRP